MYYDFVYEQNFGSFYNTLTTYTLNVIHQILPTGTILDFGAGTGRLTIPLLETGYHVIAVEKSRGMVEELLRKAKEKNLQPNLHHCSISEYENGKADMALALFTVLSYSITEEELSKNIHNICRHINPSGYFFFDLPNTVFFNRAQLINMETPHFRRTVELINLKDNIYTYREKCSGIFNGQEFCYEDKFQIRYWELSTLDKLLTQNSFFEDTSKSFSHFSSTGSTYKLYKKNEAISDNISRRASDY